MKQEKRRTLQDVVKRRQQQSFVGREENIAAFRANLELDFDDDQRKFIYAISGQGGVGKTSLLLRLRALTDGFEHGSVSAWINEKNNSVLSVMHSIAEQFSEQGHPLKTFSDRNRLYRQKRYELESASDAPSGLAGFVGNAAKFALRVGGITPAGPLLKYIDEEAAAETAKEIVEYISSKAASQEEAALVQTPVEILAPLLVSDLCTVPPTKLIALFLDTYEHIGEVIEDWLLNLLGESYGAMPTNILLAVAGRNELARNKWINYAGLMVRIPLEPFTQAETVEYLSRKSVTDPHVVQIITKLSGRLPLLVATLAAESPTDASKVGDPTGTAIDRFLQWVELPSQRELAIDASIPRWINQDIVALLTNGVEATSLFEWLITMPFIQEKSNQGWYYHEVVRSQMLRGKIRQSPANWRLLHQKLADYYQSQAIQYTDVPSSKEQLRRLQLEALYHQLCWDPTHIGTAANGFVEALRVSPSFSRQWADTMQQAGRDCDEKTIEQLGSLLFKAMTAYRDKKFNLTIRELSKLLEMKILTSSMEAGLRGFRGRCYAQTSHSKLAIDDTSVAILEFPEDAQYYYSRAVAFIAARKYDEACQDLLIAVQLKPENANYAHLCGIVYMITNQSDKALLQFDRAVSLEPDQSKHLVQRATVRLSRKELDLALNDLNRALEIAPNDILAFERRGQVHNLLAMYGEAIKDYTSALELDPARARLYAARGAAHGEIDDHMASLEDFSSAINYESDDPVNWLNRAIAYLNLGRLNEALMDAEKASELKPHKPQIHLAIAEIYFTFHQYEKALQELDMVEKHGRQTKVTIRNRVMILLRLHRLDEAEALANKGLLSDPSNEDWVEAKARICIARERYDRALKILSESLLQHHESPNMIALQAECERLMSRYQEALDAFDRAFLADESLRDKWGTSYGLTLTYLHRFGEAIEWYEEMLAENPDSYPTLYNLAVAVARLPLEPVEKYIGAARARLESLVETEDRGAGLYGLGGLAALEGNEEVAVDLLARAIPLESEARTWARHDMAWEKLRTHEEFRKLVF